MEASSASFRGLDWSELSSGGVGGREGGAVPVYAAAGLDVWTRLCGPGRRRPPQLLHDSQRISGWRVVTSIPPTQTPTARLLPSPPLRTPTSLARKLRVLGAPLSKTPPTSRAALKMITRRVPFALSTLRAAAAPAPPASITAHIRCLHANMPAARIPRPTPFVPDVETFLTLIGRKMSAHAAKIPTWEALFSLSSQQLRESGLEPARSRRYLLHWRERFRNGEFGIGGDLTEVAGGAGELRIVEVPAKSTGGSSSSSSSSSSSNSGVGRATLTSSPGMKKIVVNVPAGQEKPAGAPETLKPVGMVKIVRSGIIAGSNVEAVAGQPGVARIVAKEGLWEQKRGHKVDGGERRKAEVRSKRRAEERKTTRG
ncbi:hypothetical protein MBLNU459_g0353t1 [Dothideomycetes sp. NU459]